jgi:hypothetical protein
MKSEQTVYSFAKGWESVSENTLGLLAQLVFLFGDSELLKKPEHIEYVRLSYPAAQVVGCSTAGEIYGEEALNGSIVCTAVYLEKTRIKVVSELIRSMDDSMSIGQNLINQLEKDELVHVLVLSDGLNINGSELTKGMNERIGNKVSISGGLAGDQANFMETVTVHNQTGQKNRVLAIGFYGKHLKVGYGSMGGWDSFGVDRLVTKSKANVLYELDGQPSLSLYKKYLGDHAANLPSSALLFPLSYISKISKFPIVRTVLSVDESDGSMTFAGDIPQGEYVRLMKSSFEKLSDGASRAAENSLLRLGTNNPDLAILISCVGRKLLLKQRVDQELESVREVIGKQAVMTGFYSFGEICPTSQFDHQCELHNQTMTITIFKED